ncbi:MAG: hypothetical protein Q9186_003658 [Xanthomendoza sp. 1 TL-2023]
MAESPQDDREKISIVQDVQPYDGVAYQPDEFYAESGRLFSSEEEYLDVMFDEKACFCRVERPRRHDYQIGFSNLQKLQLVRRRLWKAVSSLESNLEVTEGCTKFYQDILTGSMGFCDDSYAGSVAHFASRFRGHHRRIHCLLNSIDSTSDLPPPTPNTPLIPYDITTFLATALERDVDFVPIAWMPGLKPLGRGGTSWIRQSIVNLEASFALKQIQFPDTQNPDEADIIRAAIVELIVLTHPPIRSHLNVLNLEGLCWDASDTSRPTRPVLVLEKSELGDLGYFMSRLGDQVTPVNRVELCADIINAVAILHANGVIHGDVKPENLLMFQRANGEYYVKLCDLGFSSLFANQEDVKLDLPISHPWNAPELSKNGQFGLSVVEAQRSDIYSVGLVCVWLLFGKGVAVPPDNVWGGGYDFITALKQSGTIDHLASSTVLGNTASWLDGLGEYFASEKMHRMCLALTEIRLGPRHPTVALLLSDLAIVVKNQDRYGEAEDYARKAFEMNQELLGPEHPQTLTSLNNLANIVSRLERYPEAESMLATVVAVYEKILGSSHHDTLSSKLNLANVLRDQRRLEEARTIQMEIVATCERVASEDRSLTIDARSQLGNTLHHLGDHDAAIREYRAVLAGRTALLGGGHPDTWSAMVNLAAVLHEDGQPETQWQEAEQLLQLAIQKNEGRFGERHTRTLSSTFWLAMLRIKMGQVENSATLFERAYLGFQETLGDENEWTQIALRCLNKF